MERLQENRCPKDEGKDYIDEVGEMILMRIYIQVRGFIEEGCYNREEWKIATERLRLRKRKKLLMMILL